MNRAFQYELERYFMENKSYFHEGHIQDIYNGIVNSNMNIQQLRAIDIKSPDTARFLAFVGLWGFDRFYIKDYLWGCVKLFFMGGFFMLWIFDIVTAKDRTKNYNYKIMCDAIRAVSAYRTSGHYPASQPANPYGYGATPQGHPNSYANPGYGAPGGGYPPSHVQGNPSMPTYGAPGGQPYGSRPTPGGAVSGAFDRAKGFAKDPNNRKAVGDLIKAGKDLIGSFSDDI